MSLEVETQDVIRLIEQFLKENHLHRTLHTLQEESGTALNTVDNTQTFIDEIHAGQWDNVLQIVESLHLPAVKLIDLYEQIVMELIEEREVNAARMVLRQTDPMLLMKKTDAERYLLLEHLLQQPDFDGKEVYSSGGGRDKRRHRIASELAQEVTVVPPSRLLVLIGHALKWQRFQGLIPPGEKFDVFCGRVQSARQKIEMPPTSHARTIKFPVKSHAESAIFSPDGHMLVTGSADGFVEVWNFNTGKLRKDLKYQSDGKLMFMSESVLSLAFSCDSEMLAAGSQTGKIRVWKVATGQTLRKFERAHTDGISSIRFSRDGGQLLTGSFDCTARIHGLKSGQTMKDFRGNTSFVNDALFTSDNTRVVTASNDGVIRIFDVKTAECLDIFRPTLDADAVESLSINSISMLPHLSDHILVCNRSNTLYIMNLSGSVVRSLCTGATGLNADLTCCVVSPQGDFAYAVSSNGELFAFSLSDNKLDIRFKVNDSEVSDILHHPHSNILATFANSGQLRLWT